MRRQFSTFGGSNSILFLKFEKGCVRYFIRAPPKNPKVQSLLKFSASENDLTKNNYYPPHYDTRPSPVIYTLFYYRADGKAPTTSYDDNT